MLMEMEGGSGESRVQNVWLMESILAYIAVAMYIIFIV